MKPIVHYDNEHIPTLFMHPSEPESPVIVSGGGGDFGGGGASDSW